MTWKCPVCGENLKFDPETVGDKAPKCPHCHEFIHQRGVLDRIREKFVDSVIKVIKNRKLETPARFLFHLFLAFLITVAVVGVFHQAEKMALPHLWFLGVVLIVVVFCTFERPLNIQPVVLIYFMTLLFVGLGTLWQKENFDLRNRPYVGIVPIFFDMTKETSDRKNKIFELTLNIQNSGEVGTILEDFEYVPFVSPNDKFSDEGEQIKGIPLKKINEGYGVIEWKNAPILPHSLIEQEIVNNPFGVSHFQLLGGDNEDVFFWLKATYRPIGERKHFYFWTIVKSKGHNKFQYMKSGDYDRNFSREYRIV